MLSVRSVTVIFFTLSLTNNGKLVWSRNNADTQCEPSRLHKAVINLRLCNPKLAELSTSVLHRVTEDTHQVCSKFRTYVSCMVSAFQCPSALLSFWLTYDLFVTSPYFCNNATTNTESSSPNDREWAKILPTIKTARDATNRHFGNNNGIFGNTFQVYSRSNSYWSFNVLSSRISYVLYVTLYFCLLIV